jgi:hypothetical protein
MWDRFAVFIQEVLGSSPCPTSQNPVQPAISHGEIIKESALKESEVSRTLAAGNDALVSFPGHLKGKWTSGIMRVGKHAACRDMDGICAMLFGPLGDLDAPAYCLSLRNSERAKAAWHYRFR